MAGSSEDILSDSYLSMKEEYDSLSKILLDFLNIGTIDKAWVCKSGAFMTFRVALTVYQMVSIQFVFLYNSASMNKIIMVLFMLCTDDSFIM